MPRCDLKNNAKNCAAMYRIAAGRPGHPCSGCETGRDRAAAAEPAVEKPTEIIPKSIPGRIPAREKEGKVDQAKVKENILRVLGRKGEMTSSNLKLYSANKETREDFRAALDALAGEGKVVTKEGAQPGSLLVALPGSPAPSNDATVPSKKPAVSTGSLLPPPSNSRAKKERPVSAPRKPAGNGVYAAAIADLEARRTAALNAVDVIDHALEALRALA